MAQMRHQAAVAGTKLPMPLLYPTGSRDHSRLPLPNPPAQPAGAQGCSRSNCPVVGLGSLHEALEEAVKYDVLGMVEAVLAVVVVLGVVWQR